MGNGYFTAMAGENSTRAFKLFAETATLYGVTVDAVPQNETEAFDLVQRIADSLGVALPAGTPANDTNYGRLLNAFANFHGITASDPTNWTEALELFRQLCADLGVTVPDRIYNVTEAIDLLEVFATVAPTPSPPPSGTPTPTPTPTSFPPGAGAFDYLDKSPPGGYVRVWGSGWSGATDFRWVIYRDAACTNIYGSGSSTGGLPLLDISLASFDSCGGLLFLKMWGTNADGETPWTINGTLDAPLAIGVNFINGMTTNSAPAASANGSVEISGSNFQFTLTYSDGATPTAFSVVGSDSGDPGGFNYFIDTSTGDINDWVAAVKTAIDMSLGSVASTVIAGYVVQITTSGAGSYYSLTFSGSSGSCSVSNGSGGDAVSASGSIPSAIILPTLSAYWKILDGVGWVEYLNGFLPSSWLDGGPGAINIAGPTAVEWESRPAQLPTSAAAFDPSAVGDVYFGTHTRQTWSLNWNLDNIEADFNGGKLSFALAACVV